jgi:hypothetical protein
MFLISFVSLLLSCGDDSANLNTDSSSKIYAFQTNNTYTPDQFKANASNLRSICSTAFASYSSSVSCSNFYPFLGKSSTNGFKTFISANNLNASAVVKLINGSTTVANSLQSMVSNGPNLKDMNTWVGWNGNDWYSGVANDGGSGNNCLDYTSDITTDTITVATNGNSFSWNYRDISCNYYDDYPFVCLCN